MNLSNWMGQLDDNLKTIPIVNLAIPGTHDSMSYSVTPKSDIAPDSEKIVKVLGKLFGKKSRKIIYRWSVTQELNVSQQLNFGIRYFDLRISSRKSDSGLYFVHGLYGSEISPIFKTISEYLDKFSEEIVILDCQHFYHFTPEHHDMLRDSLISIFGNKLCPLPWDITKVTLSWMIGSGYRVVVIYRHKSLEHDDRFWPSVRWPTPWPETTSVGAMLKFLTKTMSHRPRNAGLVTQCVLTPDVKFVLLNPCGGLRSRCSIPCFNAAIPWLQEQRPGVRGINVVIADFVETEGDQYSKVIIGLNNLLLKT